jgi:AcrR family transcriptional regulator
MSIQFPSNRARGIDDVDTIQDIGRRGMRGTGVANGATSTPASDRFRRRRAENAESIRGDLLAAAAAVVGKYGYANTSITRVTKLAGVASGTFYLYFPSRQALLDQILPEIGSRLVDYIHANTDSTATGLTYEEQRIHAYFEFCRLNPGFLRIYHEAAIFAPQAYRKHFKRLALGYSKAIKRSRANGEIPLFETHEIEALIHILMGARSYLSQLYAAKGGNRSPSSLIDVYLKVVRMGVFGPQNLVDLDACEE